ncbi:hypothetical protein [Streptomyces sp. Tue 6075]|uniref:hypothetical protein n=1 Tax=Streptomyces sp. Tue 6075 TaxID=1661694 RepID=UPI000AB12790|nr:hypothetical protein [Streptomyces sp. Tue 6075]
MTQPPYNQNQPQQPQGPYQGPTHWQGAQPGQPQSGWGQRPYQGAPGGYPGGPVPPQQKESWVARHKALTIIGGVFAFLIVIGIAAGGGDDSADTKADTVATAPDKGDAKPAAPAKDEEKTEEPAAEDKPAPKEQSQADEFKAFINENGTAAEKAAAKHIVKVQGADSDNGILDSASVYTDYEGGMMGPHQGSGKLLASAFADWKDSDNGLVTIYDKDGEILSNGNY